MSKHYAQKKEAGAHVERHGEDAKKGDKHYEDKEAAGADAARTDGDHGNHGGHDHPRKG